MNNTPLPKLLSPPTVAEKASVSRYQLYRQTHAGIYAVEVRTGSAGKAVEAFLNESPAFEGGQLGLWNQREQRVSASVRWSVEKTDFGFSVSNRSNVFHDRLLGLISRQMQVREEIREEIQHCCRMNT